MYLIARFILGCSLCFLVVCAAWAAKPEAERVTIEGLVSAAPVPAGFAVTRQDVKEGEKILGHYLVLTKEGSPTRGLVQIERRLIEERPARVAALKAYVNAAAAGWQKQGYTVKVRALPKVETIDFTKPVEVDLDATKEGEMSAKIHLEVLFDKFAYQMVSVSTDDKEANGMIEWCKSVRPVTEGAATRPAK